MNRCMVFCWKFTCCSLICLPSLESEGFAHSCWSGCSELGYGGPFSCWWSVYSGRCVEVSTAEPSYLLFHQDLDRGRRSVPRPANPASIAPSPVPFSPQWRLEKPIKLQISLYFHNILNKQEPSTHSLSPASNINLGVAGGTGRRSLGKQWGDCYSAALIRTPCRRAWQILLLITRSSVCSPALEIQPHAHSSPIQD